MSAVVHFEAFVASSGPPPLCSLKEKKKFQVLFSFEMAIFHFLLAILRRCKLTDAKNSARIHKIILLVIKYV